MPSSSGLPETPRNAMATPTRIPLCDALDGAESLGTVRISAVFDANDDYLGLVVADAVEHPVGATACRPQAGKLSTQRFAHSLGLIHQGRREEVDDRGGDGLGKPIGQGPTCWWGDDELIASCIAHRRS